MAHDTSARRSRHAVRSLAGLLAAVALSALLGVPVGAAAPLASTASATQMDVDAARLPPGLRAELAGDPTPGHPAVLRPITAANRSAGSVLPASTLATKTPPKPSTSTSSPSTSAYSGRNHVWSPTLGLDRPVAAFPCSRSRPPDMLVYRWGCAGENNVYLFAHAGGPFRRLHDLYVAGQLRTGMQVVYADGDGAVHVYQVAWWKVVLPTDGDFAWAAQSRSAMTLQTCVGANSRYRLVVRLLETD
jgi:hypothetical protein